MKDSYRKINYILAGLSFLLSFIVYVITMAPTLSFWDCGEFIATSVIMGVPHPPGSPLFLIIGNIFSQIPFFSDIGARVNFISPIVSALAVLLLYLIITQLIQEWRGPVKSVSDAYIAYGSAFIASLTFALTDSHWFNAVEAEVYAMSTFFTAIIVWLILKWAQNDGKPGNIRYILLIAYMIGLAIGVHLLNLLALPFIALIIYYKKYPFRWQSFLVVVFITGLTFAVIYLGIIKGIPNLLHNAGLFVTIIAVLSVFALAAWAIATKKNLLATVFTSMVFILIGYSTYTAIFIRATQHPAINENAPDSVEGAISYLNREQYGQWSIIDRKSTLQRPECSYWKRYTLNRNNPTTGEVLGFFWNYQVKEMYLRYFGWQFIGKGDMNWPVVNLKGNLLRYKEGINPTRYIIPLAFLLGMLGFYYHFKKDWKRALAVLALFISTGLLIIIYLNQYDPQPRERDYSYVGSFFAFAIWIGIGIAGLLETIREKLRNVAPVNLIFGGVLTLLFVMMPVNMLAKDFREHDRSGNFVAWDYAYNMLNSCEPNGIIFTNGDNDTFPLWYLQEVEGIRKDVRVVNLSLLNTPWYIRQLRDDEPKLPLKMTDRDIKNITPVYWEPKRISVLGPNGEADAITWNLRPTFAGKFLRVQDLMVYRILKDVRWERPVYFAVTVSPDNQIGLKDYLMMEGLVYRVVPQKGREINYDRMKQNITQTSNLDKVIATTEDYVKHMESGDGVYRYRNLNNPEVYFNSNIQRLIQNYRSGFLRLALTDVYSNKPDGKERAYRTLQDMDHYFPAETLPYNNPDLELQIARLYREAGDTVEFKKRLQEIEEYDLIPVETQFYIGQIYLNDLNDYESAIRVFKKLYENPKYASVPDFMQSLVQAYSRNHQTDKAIAVIENWLMLHPNDNEAKSTLEILRKELP